MFKNYLKIALRNLKRDKGYSLINVSGLSIGMAAAILILLWVKNEVSTDRVYANSDRIYRMYNRDVFSGELHAWGTTPKVMGPTIKKDYPEVEDVTRISNSGFLFTVGETKLNESGAFVDSTFFNVFDFPVVDGNIKTALNAINKIVLTESFAHKLFGKENAVGKTVKIDSSDLFTVSAVIEDFPPTTTMTGAFLLPWSYMKKLGSDDEWWGNNSVATMVLLKKNVSLQQFNNKVANITISHSDDGTKTIVFAYPLNRTYLYGKSENGKLVDGRIVTVRLFTAIAIFILLIACINFMNLSTARSEKRAKEVGVRKVVGARKSALIMQFVGESILLAIIAGVIAILIVLLCLPSFNQLVNKKLFVDFANPIFWLQLLGFIFFTGIIAGSYPAFFLSSYKPIKVLKGTFKTKGASFDPRKVLVITQFTFAIILIISTLIIQRQIKYAQDREIGYDKSNLIYVQMQGDVQKHYESIKQRLLNNGSAVGVTKSMSPITQRYSDSWGFSWPGSTEQDKTLDFIRFSTDADFLKVMGTKLVDGRDIDIHKFPSDSTAVLLNETAVKRMRLKSPVGILITNGEDKFTVVGVIKDFIFESPYDPVNPLMINGPAAWFNVLHIKLNPAHSVSEDLKLVENVFKEFNPQYPFQYHFVDEEYAKKFDDTKRTGTLAVLFAALTIIISCLGLFGLAAYMASNRVKEIGVRKVLGASVTGISVLLSNDFLRLVLISFIVATPIAWYAMSKWLSHYDYRMGIEWWVFAVTGALAILIAIITVSFQAIKAATANPVKALRSE